MSRPTKRTPGRRFAARWRRSRRPRRRRSSRFPADVEAAETRRPRGGRGLQARLAADYAPAPLGRLALRTPDGGATRGATVLGRFLHAKDFATLVVYQAPPTGVPDDQSRLLLDTIDVKDPAVVDLLSGAAYKTGPASVPGEKATRSACSSPITPWRWSGIARPRTNRGSTSPRRDVKVATTRGLTAEEIIAKNRQVQKIQDDHLVALDREGARRHPLQARAGRRIDRRRDRQHLLLASRGSARMAADALLRQREHR